MEHLLNQTALLKSKVSESGYGTPTYAEGVSIPVRWEDSVQQVKTPKGEEVTSNAIVFTFALVKPDDILVYGGIELPVFKVNQVVLGDGTIHHSEVYV